MQSTEFAVHRAMSVRFGDRFAVLGERPVSTGRSTDGHGDRWKLVRDEPGMLVRVVLVRREAFGTHHDLLRYK